MQDNTNMILDNSARQVLTINTEMSKVFTTNASNDTLSMSAARHWRRWTSSWTTMEERMQTSEPASVKHEQKSIN
ncbi:hypothetical protein DPMN_086097 [Dreissena polymorpha]|uniref:Uncharacterized protein n=1 Tax=Dreissena polymorpha TaxID=45954 RepID=A0A9D3YGY4_DREPO|nr:hypothetical protein DPMN_086097 [Dreissena polymorpha]